uniref:HET domain-containing protein n=1 Tax=Angiostrongylus cantonensis TaxID=6313 RepID=A0A158PBS8_ANGCA
MIEDDWECVEVIGKEDVRRGLPALPIGGEVKFLQRYTNISYNCVDRHISTEDNRYETAMLWEGNFWDDDVHDYADLTWDTVQVLTNKIASIFKEYCGMNPATAKLSELTTLLKETSPKLVVTVDGFWQGHELYETKKQLDKAIDDAQISSIDRILVIRHTGPNPGVPPPERLYPGRRPCYSLQVPINNQVDLLWSKEIAKACTQCEPEWLPANHPFAIIPQWTPDLYLRTITTGQLLQAAWEFSPHLLSACLSLAHPQTVLGLVGCMAPWLTGKTLAIFEGTLDHPDPSRLKHVIAKFEVRLLFTV